MILEKIKKILKAEIITGAENLQMEIKMGCGCDLMSDVLAFIKPDSLLLTGLTNPQVIRTAEMADIKAICFTRGKKPDKETVKLAKSKNIPLLLLLKNTLKKVYLELLSLVKATFLCARKIEQTLLEMVIQQLKN